MSLELFNLKDKIAIVTGSGRGLGRNIALGLADAGADVVVVARTSNDVEAVADEITAKGKRALAMPTDVRSSEQIDNLVEKTLAEFGRIDILVNNAGGTFPTDIWKVSERAWDSVVRENLNTAFLCSKAIMKVMVEQKNGSIISVSSVEGLLSSSHSPPYGAAKAAIINLTKTLAVDLAKYNIRVNAIAPGIMGTTGPLELLKAYPQMIEAIPAARIGEPEEVVGTVIYLASKASSYVTGQTIIIDGGITTWLRLFS